MVDKKSLMLRVIKLPPDYRPVTYIRNITEGAGMPARMVSVAGDKRMIERNLTFDNGPRRIQDVKKLLRSYVLLRLLEAAGLKEFPIRVPACRIKKILTGSKKWKEIYKGKVFN